MERENDRIKLSDVPFKSSNPGTYNKDFGAKKDELRAGGFPTEKTNEFIRSHITEKSIAKILKNIEPDTILLSMPVKQSSEVKNALPGLYAKQLSSELGNTHIDLSDYLKIRQDQSARNAYTASNRSTNYFNIGFKNKEKENNLKDKLYGKSILLVDDVLTTGETMVSMATFLKLEVSNLEVKGGHAMAAVSTRTPTQRDIERVNEKLLDRLPYDIDPREVRRSVEEALSKFTRKKLMRFEINLKTPEGAQMQFNNMQQDISKVQDSLKESLAANLFRYPLDKKEMKVLLNAKAEKLDTSFALRALLQHYPNAQFAMDDAGMHRLYSDNTKKQQLSVSGRPNASQADAITAAVKFIQHNAQEISNKQQRQNNRSI